MNDSLEDARLLFLVLTEMWERRQISTYLYHALLYAPQRGFELPLTVGEMRKLLRNENPRRLLAIPNIGTGSVAVLRDLFLKE